MMYRLHKDDLFINLNTIKKMTKKTYKYFYQGSYHEKNIYTIIFLDGEEETVPEEVGRNILKVMGLVNPTEEMKGWYADE